MFDNIHTVPPRDKLTFLFEEDPSGPHTLDVNYRTALFEEFPFYTSEEIVGSFLGHNPYFDSQEEWVLKNVTIVHAFKNPSEADIVPPHNQLLFGPHTIDANYKAALYEEFPMYTSKQILSSYLGQNDEFPSYIEWVDFTKKMEERYDCF